MAAIPYPVSIFQMQQDVPNVGVSCVGEYCIYLDIFTIIITIMLIIYFTRLFGINIFKINRKEGTNN